MSNNPTLKVYKASAGSGKTFRLVVEYIKLLIVDPNIYANILAVTFTNKATNEMKVRILSELYGIANGLKDSDSYIKTIQEELCNEKKKWSYDEIREKAQEALSGILHNYSRFRIETIDSFFQSILKNLAKELGLGAYVNIELDNNSVLKDAVKVLFNKVKEDGDLMNWISEYINEKLDDNKNWKLNKELEEFGKNIFKEDFKKKELEISNGSQPVETKSILKNKDSLIQYRQKLNSQKKAIQDKLIALALPFQTITKELDLDTKDFSYGDKGVANFFNKIIDKKVFPNEIGKRINECIDNAENWVSKKHARREEIIKLVESDLNRILKETEDYRSSHLKEYNSINLILKDINKLGLLNDIATIISKINNENNQFMLSDTPSLLHEMIGENDAPFIYEKVGAYIKHIMIDEFQDTSLTQWENFKPLLKEGLAQNALSLIVGDPKQSIYRWRNSDWRTISNIANEITSANVATIPMEKNWRSEENVIKFNNHLFKEALSLISAEMDDANQNMQTAYDDVEQTCENTNNGYVCAKFITDVDKEEYSDLMLQELVSQIECLQKEGIPAEDIAILVRKNKNIPVIAKYLSDYKTEKRLINETDGPDKTNYVYDVISDEAYKLESSLAIQIIIQALQYISEPHNPLYKFQLGFAYQTEIPEGEEDSETSQKKLTNAEIEEKLQKASLLPLYEMVEEIYQVLRLDKIKEQESYLHSFLDGLNDFLVNRSSDINHFLRYWDEKLKNTTIPFSSEIKGMKIMSIHKSKGLEFHSVIIPFCDWTLTYESNQNPLLWCSTDKAPYSELPLLPITHKKEMKNSFFEEQYDEELEQLYVDNLNILYVGLTRAQKNLILLGKQEKRKKKEEKKEEKNTIKNVSELLYAITSKDTNHWDDSSSRFEYGTIFVKEEKKDKGDKEDKDSKNNNIFKKKPTPASFVYQSHKQKAKFRQSNESRTFIRGQKCDNEQYKEEGNILHEIFANIKTADDIEHAADYLLFKGIITETKKEEYLKLAKEALNQETAKDWFAPDLELYNECEIVYKDEKEEVMTRRPDRVVKRGNEMTVIDYKFGMEHDDYTNQVKKYMSLIQEMGYTTKGFIWYVKEGMIVEVK
ncbi:MAG: UvrD-helicase domain-containing protein [Paludibacteraceae bacterium]|nr:UvrD-helicase domain-containing protein [Paludibacteraceae bacterium]